MSNKTKAELIAENASLRGQLVKLDTLLSQRSPQRGTLIEDNRAERKRAGAQALEGCGNSSCERRFVRVANHARSGNMLFSPVL